MLPELSHLCLIAALTMLLWVNPLVYAKRNHPSDSVAILRVMIGASALLVLLAYCGLTAAFVTNDFSVAYVANHSSRELPWFYRMTAVWGAHEGSMLLWSLLLAGWSALFAWRSKQLPAQLAQPAMLVLAWLASGFLGFILLTSNPFLRFLPEVPIEGADLNPLLQDPGFLIHPPMLYMGYVGFAIVFALVVACLYRGELTTQVARWSRAWIITAWCFLTIGITLGSWWSYRVLGWGGWWFWDPVENAALLPWLIGTALLHSVIVSEKRATFKAWTLLLGIIAFALSLLGTFIVRSGVLTSVHAFAVDPKRGVYILGFMAIVVGGSFSLFAARFNRFDDEQRFHWCSRESFLLANTSLLMVLMLTVLLGTLYPLIIDALGMGKISVGAPYFNSVFVPLVLPGLILMGIAPHSFWREMPVDKLWQRLRIALWISMAGILIIVFHQKLGVTFTASLSLMLAVWVSITTCFAVFRRNITVANLAMLCAHLGMAATLVGISITSSTSEYRLVKLSEGETAELAGYQFQFNGIESLTGPNYQGYRGTITVTNQRGFHVTLHPEKRLYTLAQMPMTNAGVHLSWWGDLYVALGEALSDDTWSLRLYSKPFVRWIWLGGILMVLGGVLALFGRRREQAHA